ncbi:helix-turn-helix domain-containing protein [Isoptericola sp. S6320L]|uniref:PucR family transcriptional regulator n=1 Tax=Isoptericola sp. S6320L TaxID=2926411 RepID=UPI001FF550BF|nr:helix-turn-helix domain-containing protein [Isoptericola sp. S6320L]MCK0115692.1 helix-turn-helix domain-containing protein [Isoptericola sp. S6320L]
MADVTALTAPPAPRAGARRDGLWSRHRAVSALLDGSCLLAELRPTAAALAMPVAGRYQVVALEGRGPAARAAGRATVARRAARLHWHSSQPVELGIVLLDAGSDAAGPAELGPLPAGVRLGVGMPVDGLTALADSRRQAETALGLCPPCGGAVRLADHLPAALLSVDPTLARQVRDQVLGPLGRAGHDRETLLDTFAVWLATDGSAQEAARRLGCHRNTVTNRLRRIEHLTGRRVDRPRDLVDLTLALHALHAGPGPAASDPAWRDGYS